MMKRFYTILITFMLVLSFESFAGLYGKIEGTVLDKDGKPVYGATVRIPTIGKGANVKSDGKYRIINIESGTYKMIISALSYAADTVMVKVSADNTTVKNIVLGEDIALLEEVVVIGEKMVSKKSIGVETKIGESEFSTAATNDVNDLVTYTAGVANSGSGFTIRGSRDNQTQVKLDGMDVGDQFSGGYGSLGAGLFPMVSAEATEEVQVKTGGFGAEYGSAMGGIVNTVVKTGQTDRYDGFVKFSGEIEPLWGSQNQNIDVVTNRSSLDVENYGDGYDAAGQGLQQLEFGFSGPIPFLDKSTFNISGNNKYYDFLSNSYDVLDPSGNNLGQRPDNSAWVKNITGRMKFIVTDEIALTLGGMWGLTNAEASSINWLYADRQQVLPKNLDENGKVILTTDADGNDNSYYTTDMLERQIKQNVTDVLVYNAFARINHSINENSFYELNFKYNVNNNTSARRQNMDDPGYFSGFEVVEPVDNITFDQNRILQGKDNQYNDYYEAGSFVPQISKDNMQEISSPYRNLLSGFYEGPRESISSTNAYGLRNYLFSGGASAYDFRFGSYWQVDGNYNLELDLSDVQHSIKTGFEFRDNTINRHYNGSPWESGDGNIDVYSNQFKNIYLGGEDPGSALVKDITSQDKGAIAAMFFVQDQIDYKGIVLTPGLRIDYFDSQSPYREYGNKKEVERGNFIQLSEYNDIGLSGSKVFPESEVKITYSPRINVKYPITDNMNLSLNYGVYYKMPDLSRIFDYFNLNTSVQAGTPVGDPNVDPERTNAFEVGFEWQLNDDFAFNIQSYYKDIYNELGLVRITVAPDPYDQVATTEYGLNKGIEFGIRKAPKDNTFISFNYTIASITGTANAFQSNSNVIQDRNIVDNLDPVYTFPLSAYSLNRDVRHRMNLLLQLFYGNDEGPTVGNFYLLENASAGITARYRSGTPYTLTSSGGIELGEKNAERNPGRLVIDLKLTKTINFSDIFGDAASNSSIELSVWANNLLDFTDAIAYYTNSSDPDKNERFLDTQIGNFQSTNFYEKADAEIPESIAIEQYDRYGERYYNVNAENGDRAPDGLITQTEMYEAFQRYYQDILRLRGNYQYPRQVYFGIKVKF